MRTLAWATIMFMSPFSAKGLVFIAPLVAVIAYTRWTVIAALVIVGSMVTMASADERIAMDADTCNEHQGDVMEHFYNKDWKVIKDTGDEWIKQKGDEQVSFRCEKGLSIIETRKVEPKVRGQVEYNK